MVNTGETFSVALFGINIACAFCINDIIFCIMSNKYISSFEDSKVSI